MRFTMGTLLPNNASSVTLTETTKGVAPLGYDEAPSDFYVGISRRGHSASAVEHHDP